VHDAGSARFAKVTIHRVALVSRASPDAELGGQVRWEREEASSGKDGARAEGRRGLLAALDAVTVVDGKRGGRWGPELDRLALAYNFHCGLQSGCVVSCRVDFGERVADVVTRSPVLSNQHPPRW